MGEAQSAGRVEQAQPSLESLRGRPHLGVKSETGGSPALVASWFLSCQAHWVLCLWPGGLPVVPPYQAGCPLGREGTWAAIGNASHPLPLIPC